MPYTKKPFGPTLKKIRENKGYTQQDIADHSMSRSNYTKFELGTIQPTVLKYLDILNHLDMSHEEFIYILNDYHPGEKELIWNLFVANMKNPSLEQTEELIEKAETHVEEQFDQLVLSILNSARAFHAILSENNMSKARIYAEKVWDRLENLDKWYFRELYLVNSILYLFDKETAVSFTQMAFEELDNYSHFKETDYLRILYKFHLSSLLMAEGAYEQAFDFIQTLAERCSATGYYLEWAIALARKGVCLQKMEHPTENGQPHIDKAKQVFQVLERKDFVEELEDDPEQFKNIYAKILT